MSQRLSQNINSKNDHDGPTTPCGFIPKYSSDVTILLSLAKFESDGQEDDYRHRMLVNTLAFVVTVALIATGVWLTSSLP
jgi:hypothetical protein